MKNQLFSFLSMKERSTAVFLSIFIAMSLPLTAWPEDDDDHDEDEHGEEISRIDADMARQVGIVTTKAAPEELHQTTTIYGRIVPGPEQVSHVRARFDGMIKSVQRTIGDNVKIGDVLSEIESNESLKPYKIRSPIAGRIVQQHANTGEITEDQVLFSIANFDTVWADLRIYPTQLSSVKEGQSVQLLIVGERYTGSINHIISSLNTPYQIARVRLDNSTQTLSPGLMAEARVEINSIPVSLAVAKKAVQTMGGRQGVFVKQLNEYLFTPLVLGETDDHYYSVLAGLEPGDEYVIENSYLIKADIGKSEVEDDD
jgi:membrane fusion protein, heavy metal efflux system